MVTGKHSQGCHIWIINTFQLDLKCFELPPPSTPFFPHLCQKHCVQCTTLFYSPNSMTVVSASLGSLSNDLLGSYSGLPPKAVARTLSSSSRKEVTVCPHRGCVPSGRVSWREGRQHNPWCITCIWYQMRFYHFDHYTGSATCTEHKLVREGD